MKDVMIANNAQVQWHPPEIGTGRFGEWLAGNIDWAISRERYWGTPLPAWVCTKNADHVEFIGSLADLAAKTGPLPENFDPHKPFIDEYTWQCSHCDGTMKRTPEVIDVWFDSGSMPYAQWHYPFENQEQWKKHFPADFICEGVDQTRGWFYSLMAISSMLGHGPAYRHVVVNDLILDKDGQKMSKSRGNVVDPWMAFAQFGADAVRWYLLSVSQPWVPKRFDPEALGEAARRTFDTLANTYRFFELYANLEAWQPGDADPEREDRPVLDRWILAKVDQLARDVTVDMEAYEVTRTARAIGEFIVDDLSNWYVRRSRDRFWGSGNDADTRAAFRTLYDVLVATARMLAPITPFHADWLHRALTGSSAHLARFPVPEREPDPDLLTGMNAVRVITRLGRAARDEIKVRVRQPLRTLYAVVPEGVHLDETLLEVARDELNVKEVRFLQAAEELVTLSAVPNFRVIGKRFGARTQAAAARIRELSTDALLAFRRGGRLTIELDGETFDLSAEELEIRQQARGEMVVESDEGFTIALDPAIDEELRYEGIARELVNRIQRIRRDSGLEVSDRIRLRVRGDAHVQEAFERHRGYIAHETLAVEAEWIDDPKALPAGAQDVDVDGLRATLALEPIRMKE